MMDRKSLKKFICLHAVLFILILILYSAFYFCSYRGGLTATQGNSYFAARFWLIIVTPLFLIACFIGYIISFFRIGLKYILPSIGLFIVFFFVIRLAPEPLVSPAGKGYYDYLNRNVDINEIHQWLVNYKHSKYEFVDEDGTKRGRVFDDDWPECIKALNPTRGVLIFESEGKKYIRISYAVDWELSIGLCAMEEPMDVPEFGYDFTDRQFKLSDNAFVWAGD